ncbi:helix-turn-helix domain-containing protein [Candidatus Bathyarchaeota archaeon]|nr:helix-turn-helix domain-containing protein [Candidatus Bathyarchaeota archaeon]
MFRKEVLENESRRRIYWFVKRNPGLHLRELQRRLEIPLTSLDYHLGYLSRHELLSRDGEGFYTRYFDEELDEEDREILALLRQRRLREIVLVLISESKASYGVLMSSLSLPASTLSLYLKKLVDGGVVLRHSIGRENYYTLSDVAKVGRLLIVYRTSFLDRLIDNALVSLLETRFKVDSDDSGSE